MPLPTLQQFNAPLYQPTTMKLQGMKIQDMQKRTGLVDQQVGMQRDRLNLDKKEFSMKEEQYNLKKLQDFAKKAKDFLPQVNADNYDDYLKWIEEGGADIKMFKTPEEYVAMPPEQQEAYKLELAKDADDLVAMDLETLKKKGEGKPTDFDKMYNQEKEKRPNLTRKQLKNEMKATKDGEAEKNKKLESLKSDFMQQIGRGYSAERGTGQFIPDENKMKVAKKAYDSAQIIAQTYVDAGGKWEDLGLEDPSKAPEAKDGDFVTQLTETHPPAEYKGKSGTDTDTGKKYKSDGKNWVEVK